MARKYELVATGEKVETLSELAKMLGLESITEKDIKSGGQYSDLVEIIDSSEEEVDKDVIYETVTEGVEINPEQVEASLPDFETLDELKEFIKDLDTPTLEYIAKGLGVEWKPTYHPGIHRMRMAMAVHRHFFPELFKPKTSSKKKTKYGDFSTEELEKMAIENEVVWKKSDNEAINRVQLISALKGLES